MRIDGASNVFAVPGEKSVWMNLKLSTYGVYRSFSTCNIAEFFNIFAPQRRGLQTLGVFNFFLQRRGEEKMLPF